MDEQLNQNNNVNADPEEGERMSEKIKTEVDKQNQQINEAKNREGLIGTMAWAAILIWVGVVFLAKNLGWLENLQNSFAKFPEGWEVKTWSLIFLGAGLILLTEGLIRLIFLPLRKAAGGTFLLAAILIGIGMADISQREIMLPIILIGVGLAIITRGLILRHKREDT